MTVQDGWNTTVWIQQECWVGVPSVDTDSHGGDVWFIRGFLAWLIDVNGGTTSQVKKESAWLILFIAHVSILPGCHLVSSMQNMTMSLIDWTKAMSAHFRPPACSFGLIPLWTNQSMMIEGSHVEWCSCVWVGRMILIFAQSKTWRAQWLTF